MSDSPSTQVRDYARGLVGRELARLGPSGPVPGREATVAAVLVSFNKREFVRRNLAAIHRQTVPFDQIIVVDNCSSDGSIDMIRESWPKSVRLEVMPHSRFGACETFNIGFRMATTDYIAILDDDVVLPDDWVERMLAKAATEPATTAMISSKVHEPEEPEWYSNHP